MPFSKRIALSGCAGTHTHDYLARHITEGKTRRGAIRCLSTTNE
jgi:hypothetical protein